MKIVLINPPHTAIGSRVPDDHLPPLGLLALGGPLIDAGHEVRLVDAEFGPMPLATLVRDALSDHPDCILIGHSGSTSAHPTALQIARMIKDVGPAAMVIYGGVFPTYHWRDILAETDVFDFIVRGEGEATVVALVEALERRRPLSDGRHRVSRRFAPSLCLPAGKHDRQPRCIPRRLGAHRSQPLQLLGRQACRGHAVFTRLSASVQLLRPAWFLDTLAASRPREIRARDCLVAP
jgi:radical SAM superfamily enzyme YgiQ (UPF0313 family)